MTLCHDLKPRRQLSINLLFYLLTFPPIATQSMKNMEVREETRAALADAQGTYIPRLNRPRTGPPKMPKIPSQAWTRPGMFFTRKVRR